MPRGGAARKLVGLITRRSQVQILPPQLNAQIAQSVEQRTENPRVAGSIPALGICHANMTFVPKYLIPGHISLYKDGILAQVVEHLTFNQVVRGSSPRCLMNEEGLQTYIL